MKEFLTATLLIIFCNISYAQSISIFNNKYIIDTTIINQGKNLDELINTIKESHFNSFESKSMIPKFILRFLKATTSSNFKIASLNQSWQWGCVSNGLPKRHLQKIWCSDSLFIMTYETGGKSIGHHILILRFNKKRIIDFWCGYYNNENNIDGILKLLNDSKNNTPEFKTRWALK
jgi:hypothetical protein